MQHTVEHKGELLSSEAETLKISHIVTLPTCVMLSQGSRWVRNLFILVPLLAFGINTILENLKNAVAVARVGDSGNLRQNSAGQFAPNGL